MSTNREIQSTVRKMAQQHAWILKLKKRIEEAEAEITAANDRIAGHMEYLEWLGIDRDSIARLVEATARTATQGVPAADWRLD